MIIVESMRVEMNPIIAFSRSPARDPARMLEAKMRAKSSILRVGAVKSLASAIELTSEAQPGTTRRSRFLSGMSFCPVSAATLINCAVEIDPHVEQTHDPYARPASCFSGIGDLHLISDP